MPPLFALAAAPTTANQGGLDARRLLDRLYQETVGQPMPPFCAANVGSLILPTAPFTAPSPTPVPWFFVSWLRRRWDWMRSNWAGPSGQLW